MDTRFIFSYQNDIRDCKIHLLEPGTRGTAIVGGLIETNSTTQRTHLKSLLTTGSLISSTELEEPYGAEDTRCYVHRFIDLPCSFPGLHFAIRIEKWVWPVGHTGPFQNDPKLFRISDPSVPEDTDLFVAYHPNSDSYEIMRLSCWTRRELRPIAGIRRVTADGDSNEIVLSIYPEAMEVQFFTEIALAVVLVFEAKKLGETLFYSGSDVPEALPPTPVTGTGLQPGNVSDPLQRTRRADVVMVEVQGS
ncbi:hypothetical protein V5O48_010314 [Marasmius crinis-equi]|uniref:Uncharacterized protein n=1 Tax=Marasmius crinis-equi TaxID=585013 RepID=A0ABR3F8S2_9AGAR